MSTIYLYIKQHQITGLKYFGKTYCQDLEKYLGAGLHWKRHLKKHGKVIETLCVWEFDNQEECTKFALQFSKENDIVNSPEWANLIDENGLDGGSIKGNGKNTPKGEIHKEKHRGSNSHWSVNKCHSEETKRKQSEILKQQYKKGRIPWNKGISFARKTKNKVKYKEIIYNTFKECIKITGITRAMLLKSSDFLYIKH